VATPGRRTGLDGQLAAALLGGVVFWAALWWWSRPEVDPGWPVREPLRFALLAIVYPVLEEIVFRGGLQVLLLKSRLGQRRWRGVTGANAGTSVVFSVAHLVSHTAVWAAALVIPSLVFGYFRDRDASLVIPIALHIYYNAGYFLLFGS